MMVIGPYADACLLIIIVRWIVDMACGRDDVIKWKHFPRHWPFVRGIHRWPVNSPHKGQWHGALMFSVICAWINSCVNNREAGDLRCHCAHYDVTVMVPAGVSWSSQSTFLAQAWHFGIQRRACGQVMLEKENIHIKRQPIEVSSVLLSSMFIWMV